MLLFHLVIVVVIVAVTVANHVQMGKKFLAGGGGEKGTAKDQKRRST